MAFLLVACARQPPPFSPSPTDALAARDLPQPRSGPGVEPVVALPARNLGVALDPRLAALADPIVNSPWASEDRLEERIEWWISYWQTRARDVFQRALTRMGRYEDYIDAELAARGMPASLRYLPIIEASYYPRARSPAGAGGLWQFMPATARWLGLKVNAVVDQRLDPYASTPQALDYLAELQKQFESWFLTLAAYNSGPGRVERAIRAHGDGQPRDDALFRRIREHLPPETRDFIPKYLAAVRVASYPESFGLKDYVKEPPQVLDEVLVQGAASIDVIAEAAGVAQEEVELLNPHLLRGLTPAAGATMVRLPRGTGEGFETRLAAVPPADRVTFTEHRVAAGETLSAIARNYGVAVGDLQAANPAVEPRRMQIGTVLVVPKFGPSRGSQTAARKPVASGPPPVAGPEERPVGGDAPPIRETVHVVRRGESLWLISRLYEVDVERLRRHNDLDEGALLRPGDRIRIPPAD